jgi:hypothetical protein
MRAIVPEHVVYRTFVSETVVLNLQSGLYHGINATGGRMMDLMDQRPSLRAVAAGLAEEFGRPAEEMEADVLEFSRDLLERGLIELRPADAAAG